MEQNHKPQTHCIIIWDKNKYHFISTQVHNQQSNTQIFRALCRSFAHYYIWKIGFFFHMCVLLDECVYVNTVWIILKLSESWYAHVPRFMKATFLCCSNFRPKGIHSDENVHFQIRFSIKVIQLCIFGVNNNGNNNNNNNDTNVVNMPVRCFEG